MLKKQKLKKDMDEAKKYKEASIDSCCSDTDLIAQLREKIRSQAHRLRSLEGYRMLCEQRIQELFPEHPIPVRQEHLGVSPSATPELQMAKQKISRLESQISQLNLPGQGSSSDYTELKEKLNEIIRDKAELEESLRAEMLNCEEQRTYIEVLKQTIETKVMEYAGKKFEQGLIERPQSRSEDSRREQVKTKNSVLDLESQVKRLNGLLKAKESELEGLKNEKAQLEEHLANAAEALGIAEEEVDKLEEEKSSLIEYIDEHSTKEKEMEKELNEISKYFEEMKISFDEAKESLTQAKGEQVKLKIENEVLQEEAFKANKIIKDLQGRVSSQRTGTNEKDEALKKIKEEKLACEIKAESLLANNKKLAEALQKAQDELEECEIAIETIKQQNFIRGDATEELNSEISALSFENTSLKETVESLQASLSTLKSDHNELERMRELDIKQLQEFKAKVSQYKSKCDSLEEEKRFRAELEQYRKLDAEKFRTLQEEYNDIKQSYIEAQQRELIQIEAINELRKNNSELSHELEEIYKEQQQFSSELSRKSNDFETISHKFETVSKDLGHSEAEKKKLQMQLKAEKNNIKVFTEKSEQNQAKAEELTRNLIEVNKKLDTSLKNLRLREDELQAAKSLAKEKEREADEARYAKARMGEEIKDLGCRLEEREKELEKMQNEIVGCCKAIAAFAGKYTIPAFDAKSLISTAYKDFLVLWKDKVSSNPKIFLSWITNTVEEIELLLKQLSEIHKEHLITASELQTLKSRLGKSASEESSHKSEVTKLKNQLESAAKKHDTHKETCEKESQSLRTQLSSLKSELGRLSSENSGLKDSLQRSLYENSELRLNSEVFKSTLKNHEDRVSLLKTEKTQLESLLAQVQKNIGSTEINKIYNEISRNRDELESLERERMSFECQLLKFETDPRCNDSEEFREISQKLTQCERQIRNYKKNIQNLQEDVSKEEMVQRLRGSDKETTRKNPGHGAAASQIINLVNPRQTQSPFVSRAKSHYS